MITELVDHLPASDKVPTPLKMFGRIPGTPEELTYSKDIYRYFDALDTASDRVKVVRIGKTEEGRDMIAAVIADEATIRTLDKWKGVTAKLTDSRTLKDAQAKQLITTGKPIYYLTGSIHSPGDRQPRDADGAGLSSRGGRDAVHPEHPQQRHHRHHAARRSGRA